MSENICKWTFKATVRAHHVEPTDAYQTDCGTIVHCPWKANLPKVCPICKKPTERVPKERA